MAAGGSKVMINSSRAIIYASAQDDYAIKAKDAAQQTQQQINELR
jgi:hypothetical protein